MSRWRSTRHPPRAGGDRTAHPIRHWFSRLGNLLVLEASTGAAAWVGVPYAWDLLSVDNARRHQISESAGADPPLGRHRLVRETSSLLSGLGATPSLVASSLERLGTRGELGCPDRSPLAEYLRAVLGGDPAVQGLVVGTGAVKIVRCSPWRLVAKVSFPPPVSIFVAAFEAGLYPELTTSPPRNHDAAER